MSQPARLRVLVVLLVLGLAGTAGGLLVHGSGSARQTACAPRGADPDAGTHAAGGLYRGPLESISPACRESPGHPESFADLARANSSLASRRVAPGTSLKPGAYRRRGVAGRRPADRRRRVAAAAATTPLHRQRHRLRHHQGLDAPGPARPQRPHHRLRPRRRGQPLRGDVQRRHLEVDRQRGDVDARSATGCPRRSSAAWRGRSADGGTLIALTGDDAFGGDAMPGLGVYYSRDGGATWKHAHRRARRRARLQDGGRPDATRQGLRGDRRRAVPLDRRRRELHQRQPAHRRPVPRRTAPASRRRSRTASWPTWSPTSSCRARERADARRQARRRDGGRGLAGRQQAQRRRRRCSRPATASTSRRPARPGSFTNTRHGGQLAAGAAVRDRPADPGADRPHRAGHRQRRRRRTTTSSTRSSRTP